MSTVITSHKDLGVECALGGNLIGREVFFFSFLPFFFVMESPRCLNSCISRVVWTILHNNIL